MKIIQKLLFLALKPCLIYLAQHTGKGNPKITDYYERGFEDIYKKL
jgi:hypothetical protein